MAALPITRVETFSDDDVSGAVEILADSDDGTFVTVSSAGDAVWMLHLNGSALAGAACVNINVRLRVLSSDGGFRARIRLQDPAFTSYAEGTVVAGGLNSVVRSIGPDFFADTPAGWTYAVAGGPNTLAGLIAKLGPAPILYVAGYDGAPYEVEMTHAEVVAESVNGGQPPLRVVARPW